MKRLCKEMKYYRDVNWKFGDGFKNDKKETPLPGKYGWIRYVCIMQDKFRNAKRATIIVFHIFFSSRQNPFLILKTR